LNEQKPFDNKQLLYKLVKMYRWDERRREARDADAAAQGAGPGDAAEDDGALRALRSLALDRDAFARAMLKLEARLTKQEERAAVPQQPPAAETPAAPDSSSAPADFEHHAEWERLWSLLEASASLRELFVSAPLLSEADPRAVETLAQFADFTPDGQFMLNTQDAIFMGVLDAVMERDQTDAGRLSAQEMSKAAANLFAEHFGKALAVQKAGEGLAARLAVLSATPHWQAVLASLEEGRDYTDGAQSEAGKALQELQPQATPELRAGFSTPPRLSQMQPALFALAWEKRNRLGEALDLVPAGSLGAAQGLSLRPAGAKARELLSWWRGEARRVEDLESALRYSDRARARRLNAVWVEDLEFALRLRVEMAHQLIQARKDAKVETLIYKWPEAARLALANPSSILNVESYQLLKKTVAPPPPHSFTTEEELKLYKLCDGETRDEQFVRLLDTQPYFSKIRLFHYLSAAPLPPPSPTASTTPTAARQTTEPTPRQTEPPKESDAAPPPAQSGDGYDTFIFSIDHHGGLGEQVQLRVTKFTLTPDGKALLQYELEKPVTLSPPALYRELIETAVGTFGENSDPQPLLSRMFSRTDREYLFRVEQAGKTLYNRFFAGLGEKGVPGEFSRDRGVRVMIACDPELSTLPWEWLTFPGEKENFVLSDRHSLVRLSPPALPAGEPPKEPEFAQRLTPPLRVLIAMPSYEATTRDEVEKRATLLEAELAQRGVMTRRLSGDGVTPDSFRDAVNEFLPHVLHYEGGYFLPDFSQPSSAPQPGLVLSIGESLGLTTLKLATLKKELKAAGLQLMVLQNSPFVPQGVDAMMSLVEGLVGEAVPAALAPVRMIGDAPGLEFVRAFYRALMDGQKLEAAVARARLELLSKGGDWSAYALFFSDLKTLTSSRLLPPPMPSA
jgi:CHAT domain